MAVFAVIVIVFVIVIVIVNFDIGNQADCVGRKGSSAIGRKVAVFAVIPPFRPPLMAPTW